MFHHYQVCKQQRVGREGVLILADMVGGLGSQRVLNTSLIVFLILQQIQLPTLSKFVKVAHIKNKL